MMAAKLKSKNVGIFSYAKEKPENVWLQWKGESS